MIKTVKESLDKNQKAIHKEFPQSHWLSNENNATKFFMWNTYYRRNPHRFAKEYLGLSLHWYQSVLLYLMFLSNFIVIVAARASAKSFSIAIYSVCKAILYPNSKIVLTSGTRGQSKLIVTEKIQQELWDKSPNLRREISRISSSQVEVMVKFKNGSAIETVTCSENALGHRSTVNVGEEAKTIEKSILDKVISPFRIVRQVPFMTLKDYRDDPQFREEPTEILISSSIAETHWLYKQACVAKDGMFDNDGSFFIALDYAITLKHGIRTRKQMVKERKKLDPITWMIEYENAVLRSNANAYFTYDLVDENQVLKRAFYPRKNDDVITKSKNKYDIPKQAGEIRVIACDIAAIDRSANDNSVFTCLRLFQESVEIDGKLRKEFRIQVPYLEGNRGRETSKQAMRIRQLFNDFDADFIVLDSRNLGISVYDCLAKILYDDERCLEYPPLKCMNDEVIANRIINSNAEPIIYCISASAKLNSEMAANLRSLFLEHKIDLLIPKDDGVEEIVKYIPEYQKAIDPDEQLYYEKPYLETMLLINELINLEYEKSENTGLIRLREQSGYMKDRYSSLAMGCIFVSQLERDLLRDGEEEIDLDNYTMCVSSIPF